MRSIISSYLFCEGSKTHQPPDILQSALRGFEWLCVKG